VKRKVHAGENSSQAKETDNKIYCTHSWCVN